MHLRRNPSHHRSEAIALSYVKKAPYCDSVNFHCFDLVYDLSSQLIHLIG